MSGYPDQVIAEHRALGIEAHYLQKPFTEASLLAEVHSALAQTISAGQ